MTIKVWLVLYVISGGVDVGPPPIEVESMAECQSIAASYLTRGIPRGADIIRVGCLQEIAEERS